MNTIFTDLQEKEIPELLTIADNIRNEIIKDIHNGISGLSSQLNEVLNELEQRGIKPSFWLNLKTASLSLLYRFEAENEQPEYKGKYTNLVKVVKFEREKREGSVLKELLNHEKQPTLN